MSKLNSQFLAFVTKQSKRSLLVPFSFLLLTLAYPGHNQLQSIVLRPGPVFTPQKIEIALADYPLSDGEAPPAVASTSYIVQDISSKTVIAQRRPDVVLPPASITKLMTALVALETWPDKNTVLTVQNEDRAIGQTIELSKGDQLSVDSLLHGLLIHSGNDAALTLADNYCAPTKPKGEGGNCGYSAFVAAMNQKAKDLNLLSTVYKNPSGIDQYGHLTSARDIATLASVALTDPYIQGVVAKEVAAITDVTGTKTYELESTDELLSVLPGLKGGKTGWTTGAGECFVSYVERDGRGIITVVLGSADRFADTTRLVEWVYEHHNWVSVDSPR
ncbi:D-alanyl-D-alanine carboxypeptidase [Candidatus Woesebacteria bacterium]|nr:D-alanyl-D-alanine carboxypeptidase [Candidatus Woesebacteria bacterium]